MFLNVRSIRNKTIYLNDYIATKNYDIAILCETWLIESDERDTVCVNELLPDGYTIERVDRNNGQIGGGLAIVYKQHIQLKFNHHTSTNQFEYILCTINVKNKSTSICAVYRPPPSQVNGLSTPLFIAEWSQFLSELVTRNSDLVIIGDINIPLDRASIYEKNFTNSLEETGLRQHIHEPTHCMGHILDVLIGRDDSSLIDNVSVLDIGLSTNTGKTVNDHYAIIFTLNHSIMEPNQAEITYRKFRDINIESFKADIRLSTFLNDTTGSADDLISHYMAGLSRIIDMHAPLLHKTITLRPHAPWYTEEIRDAKQLRRKLERRWRENKLKQDQIAYRTQCAAVAMKLHAAKTTYYSNKIAECKGDVKALYKITDKLLNCHHRPKLPSTDNTEHLPTQFLNFFEEKITNIRQKLSIRTPEDSHTHDDIGLTLFRPATEVEVNTIITRLPNKSCELDPIPTWLLKSCISDLLPLVT